MRHLSALLIKFTFITIILLSVYGIFDPGMTVLWIMAGMTTLVLYFLGDLVVLPKLGDFAAIAGDFVLSLVLVWSMSLLFLDTTLNRGTAAIISAAAITAVEVLFHLYIKKRIFTNSMESYIPAVSRDDGFATEFSEELNDRDEQSRSDEKEFNHSLHDKAKG